MTRRTVSGADLGLLAFGAVCIGFSPAFIRALDPNVIAPTAAAFWRTLIGAIVLFGICLVWRHPLRAPREQMIWIALAGFSFYLDLFFWHRAIYSVGAGMATILGNTQVFASAVFGYFLFRERITARFLFAALAGLVGVTLMIGFGSHQVVFGRDYLVGVGFGLATGLCYASYMLSLKKAGMVSGGLGTVALMAWASLYTAVFSGISSLVEQVPAMPQSWFDVSMLAGVGILVQSLGWFAIASTLPKMESWRSGLILLLQPTLATVWGMLLFGESFAPLQAIGAAVTLVAIYLGSLRDSPAAPHPQTKRAAIGSP